MRLELAGKAEGFKCGKARGCIGVEVQAGMERIKSFTTIGVKGLRKKEDVGTG